MANISKKIYMYSLALMKNFTKETKFRGKSTLSSNFGERPLKPKINLQDEHIRVG